MLDLCIFLILQFMHQNRSFFLKMFACIPVAHVRALFASRMQRPAVFRIAGSLINNSTKI